MRRFAYKIYHRPLLAPLRTARGWWAEREGIIVRLADGSGRVGFGEIAPIPWFGTETLAEAGEICRKLGDHPREEDLDAIAGRFGCVRFALDCARRQIVGREFPIPPMVNHNKPKAGFGDPALQTGHGDPAPQATARRLPVAALLPAGRESRATLRAWLETGFLAFKWKVGVAAIDEELGWLDELLAELPTHARLRLDANGAWTRRQAVRWLERCANRPVEFIEQPVPPADVDTLVGLAADYPGKLALDESVVRLNEARAWQERGWPGVFVIKPALVGPLPELAAWIESTSADVVISSAIETVVGRTAILQWTLTGGLTSRALGFGAGAVFGDPAWDGPELGPIVDDGAIVADAGETLWQSLGPEGSS